MDKRIPGKWYAILTEKKALNILILVVYYLLVVLPHEQVGILTVKIFGSLSRSDYNLLIATLAALGLLLYIFLFFKKTRLNKDRRFLWFFLLLNVVLAVLCFRVLFVINIEAIHFVQYAFFALLCFPLFKNYALTIYWSMLAGTFDEVWQYFYLAPERTGYLDFNDVIINMIGAGFGLILIRSFAPKVKPLKLNSISFKISVFSLILLVSGIIALLRFRVISLFKDENSLIPLYLVKPEGFWSEVPPKVKYHIMMPMESIIIIILLLAFYSALQIKSERLGQKS
jgi:VanZ family protein